MNSPLCRSFILIALLIACAAAKSAERIGLVLGGGGARGSAHIGVLKVLEREHIPIHAIAGTSVGAIIGGLYAAGYSPDEIEKAIGSIDWVDIFDDGTSRPDRPMRQKETDIGNVANLEIGIVNGSLTIPTALVRGQKLELFLRKMFLGRSPTKSFDDLPIPFRCVATDIGAVRPVVLDSGELEEAIRASMAVPGAFSPVRLNGKVLVDGGIVNNLPIEVARKMGVDRLIVVDVGEPLLPADKVNSSLEILMQMISGMMRDQSEQSLAALTDQDILLRPALGELSAIGFLQVMDGVRPGMEAAEAKVDQLRRWSVPETEYLAWRAGQRKQVEIPKIEFVRVDGKDSKTSEFVRARITAMPNQPLDLKTLERDIGGAYGRGTYDTIHYRMVTDADGRTGIEVIPTDTHLGRTLFRVGLQLNDDFQGRDDYQLNLDARVTNLNSKGAELRGYLGIGRMTGLSTDLYLPFGGRGDFFFNPAVDYSALNLPLIDNGLTIAEYRVDIWQGHLRAGYDFSDRVRLSLGIDYGHDRGELLTGIPALPQSKSASLGGLNATLLWDTLDNVRFPRRGMRAELSYTAYDERLGADENGNLLRLAIDKAMSSGPNTLMFGGRYSVSKDRVDSFQTLSALGGLTYLSGLGQYELLGEQLLLVRGIYFRRLNNKASLISVPVYLAGSLEGGNVWSDYDDVSFNDLIGAASIFLGVDLPIGPLQFGYGRTFDGRQSFYLTFSSLVLPRYR